MDIRKNFYSVRVIDKWNNIPAEVKASNSVASFKSYLEKSLIDQY